MSTVTQAAGSEGIAPEIARGIDALFASVDRPDHPGAAVAIVRNGAVAYLRCFGLANVEDNIAVTPQTVFRLGSVSKHFCATAILILENRGLLSLDDDVARHIPEMPPCAAGMTLRHLLTMTSGMHDGIALTIFSSNAQLALAREQHLELVRRYDRLIFEPGTQTLYANTNYFLLSLIIERLSGKSLREFFADELFKPLGMSSARVIERMVEAVPRKARGYMPSSTPGRFEAGLMLYEATGDGAVDMSIEDFVRWFQNYRDDRVFGPRYRERLEVELRLPDGRPLEYGLGMSLTRHRNTAKVSHAGGMPGYLADFNFYPQLDCGVLVLTNWMDPGLLEVSDRIVDLLTGESAPPQFATAPAGFYLCAERAMALEIQDTPAGSRCFLMGEGALLTGSRESGYESAKRGAGYRIEPLKRAGEMVVSFGSGPHALFKLWQEPSEGQALEDLTGAYRSPLLGETHYVRIAAGGELEITLDSSLRRLSWRKCTHRAKDVFTADVRGEPTQTNLTVRFVRDGKGTVSGMTYTTYRCRDLFFKREAE